MGEKCNAMFCVLKPHPEDDIHMDAVNGIWEEPTPEREVIAHVYCLEEGE